MNNADSTWGNTSVDIGKVENFVRGLQDEAHLKNKQGLKAVEIGVLTGVGVWGVKQLRNKRAK